MWLCVFPSLQSKVLHKNSSTLLGPYIYDKKTGHHLHLLAQPYPSRIHTWQEIFPAHKFGFVQQNRRFGFSPDKPIYLLLMSTTTHLLLRAWDAHYNQLDKTSVLFNGGYHQMMHHNNCPQQTQFFDILLHYCVHFHLNPHYNWLNQKSVLICGDSRQLVHQNHWHQYNQFFYVIPHYFGHFHPNPIIWWVYFEIPGLQFLRWIVFLTLTSCRGPTLKVKSLNFFKRDFHWKLANACILKEMRKFSLVIIIQ